MRRALLAVLLLSALTVGAQEIVVPPAGSAGASGANTALSNLGTVTINTSLISDTANTDDLGSLALPWRSLYLGTSLLFPGVNGLVDVPEPAATTGASVAGKTLTLRAADAVASTDTAGAAAGGDVTITAGAAARLTSGNANGGNINLVTGAGIGTGTAGQVVVPSGTAAVPGLVLSGEPDDGFHDCGTNCLGISTAGALQLQINSASIGFGQNTLEGGRWSITAYTTDGNISANESLFIYTNTGATSLVTRTLPTAAAGHNVCFYVADGDGLKIQAAAGDEIRIAGTATATAGYIINSTIGSSICLVAIDATTWVAINAPNGTWTFDTP